MSEADDGMVAGDSFDFETFRTVSLSDEVVAGRNVVGFDSRDRRSRPFNLMRTQLAKRLVEDSVKLVGITSATPAAGKSFVSANLAASLSRILQGPTVLADLDLRRGCVAAELGLQFETGISDFLSGKTSSLNDIGIQIEGSRLTVFPTRAVTNDSAQAIANLRFEQLIAALRSIVGDGVIIFDLPPVFANDDAALAAAMLDGYLMVVDSGKTSRRQLTDALDMLKPVPCLGTVLNRYSGGILDSYGYGSGTYDSYYSS